MPEYVVGTQFKTRGKSPRLCTVQDCHKTYNIKGELVKVRYVVTHEFVFGQIVTDYDVVAATIALGLIK